MTTAENSLERHIDHDLADFEHSYRSEFTRAARLAHLLTGSNAAAEDIAQEALVRVGDRLATIDDPSAYLTRTVVNLCRSHYRSDARRSRRELRVVSSDGRLASMSDAATDAVEHGELLALVDDLPFRQRLVLVARYWLDMAETDIAELVGCRPGTVKSLASRALTTLRKELR